MGEDGDRTPAERPGLRVGHDERTAALKALDTHFEAGRLDVSEYGDRAGVAGSATYRHELEALFTDLPAPHPRFSPEDGAETSPERALDQRPVRHRPPVTALLPILLAVGLVLLVVVGGQPAGFVLFPMVFLLAGRFGHHRRF
jgi:hypothetical protein